MTIRARLARWGVACLAVALCAGEAAAQTTGARVGTGSTGSTGSSASTVGGGFTGGGNTTGGGFTGGGNTSGGGFTGGTGFTPQASRGGNTTTTIPSSANPFQSTYANPMGIGLVDVTGKQVINKNFGQPLYAVYSTQTTTTGTAIGGFGVAGGFSAVGGFGNTGGVGYGFTTFGMGRTPVYAAVPGETMPIVVHSNPQLQATVVDVLQRNTTIKTAEPFRVKVQGSTVFLEGTVASAKDKRVVEGMIRLTPGVRDVVNNLEISEVLPAPKTGPPAGP